MIDQATLGIRNNEAAAQGGARPLRILGVWGLRLAGAVMVLAVIGLAVVQGLELRQWLWERTQTIRFQGDITNGFNQGLAVVLDAQRELPEEQRDVSPVPMGAFLKGYLNRYEEVEEQRRRRGWHLDYPPGRLLIMSLWVRHVRVEEPTAVQWQEHFTAPLLRFNAMLEMLAAIGMFVLVYHWLSRERIAPSPGTPGEGWGEGYSRSRVEALTQPSPRVRGEGYWPWRRAWEMHRPWVLGLLAAALLWFNPAVLWNAHAWPQWDTWINPFYIWAAVLASVGWWFGAGLLVAAGCMLKGQILLAAPVLVLWPLFAGRPCAAARVLLGFGVGVVVIASPLLVREVRAWVWLGGVVVFAGSLVLLLRQRGLKGWGWKTPGRERLIAAGLLLVWLVWPWVMVKEWKWMMGVVLGAVLLAAHPLLLRRMNVRHILAGVVLIGIILAAVRFDASMAWYRIGFAQGTEQYQQMSMGPVNNLATIMEKHGWRLQDPVGLEWAGLAWLGVSEEMPVQKLLRAVYVVLLGLCAVGLAVHDRRGSSRVLIALAAPWVVFFAVLPQMHERYLVWAAALSAAGVAVGWRLGVGMLLMHLLVTWITLGQMAESMLGKDPTFAPAWLEFLRRSRPDLGWVVLLAAGVYLYLALVPGVIIRAPDRRSRELLPGLAEDPREPHFRSGGGSCPLEVGERLYRFPGGTHRSCRGGRPSRNQW